MGNQAIQASLTGGELAPSLWGRTDMALYQISLKTCRNFIVQPYGGVKNRAGTRFVCEVKDSSKQVRLIPFAFNEDQTYVLECGNLYARVIRGGDQVVYSSGPNVGSPVEVATPFLEADLRAMGFAQSADVVTFVHTSYAPRQLSRTAHDAWSMAVQSLDKGPFLDINTDKAVSVYASANVGSVTLTASREIFTADRVGQLFYMEQKDFGIPWEVNKAIAVGDMRRSDGKYYRAMIPGTTGQLRPTTLEDRWSDGGVDWAYVHSGFGVAKVTDVAADHLTATATVLSRIPDGSSAASAGVLYGPLVTVTAFTVNPDGNVLLTCTHGLPVTPPFYGIALVSKAGGATGTDTVSMYVVDATHVVIESASWDWSSSGSTITSIRFPLSASTCATYKWAWGAFGDPAIGGPGYPASISYHQQRLVFAATVSQPQTLWMSRTASWNDFGKSSPIQDDDAITSTLASTRMNSIKAMHPMESLVVLTAGGEWVAGAGQSDVLTPANTTFKRQGYRGSAGLPVIGVGNTALFVQDKGQVIRDLAYEFASNSYSGRDLTAKASHLTEGHRIVEWAFQQTPFQCVWAVRDDGALLGLTYMRDQEVVGWHRHDTDGFYESVCVVGEGSEDVVYVVVRRTIAGVTKRYIERMESRLVLDMNDAFFVDSGLSYDGRNTTATTVTLTGGTLWDENETLTATASSAIFTGASDIGDQLVFWIGSVAYRITVIAYTSPTVASVRANRILDVSLRGAARSGWAWARDTFAGLSHLEGKEVAILADGIVQDRKTVSGGKISISPPGARVHVGLPIRADLETLDLSVPGIETLLPKTKAIPSATVLVQETPNLWVGRDFNNLQEQAIRTNENYDEPTNVVTGKLQVRFSSTWDKSGTLAIRQDNPLPIGILAIIPDVTVGGA